MILDAMLSGLYAAIAVMAFAVVCFIAWMAIIALYGVYDWIKGELHAVRHKKRF